MNIEGVDIVENKNNGVLIGIIVVLLVALLGLSCYMAYDKGLIFNNEKNNEETGNDVVEDKVEEIALGDARFIDIYNKLKDYTYTSNRENGYSSFTDAELAKIAIFDLKNADFMNKVETVIDGGYYGYDATLDAELLINNLKKYFEQSVTFDKYAPLSNTFTWVAYVDDIHGEGHVKTFVSYDESTNTYKVHQNDGMGGVEGPHPSLNLRKIVSAKKINDTIVVEEKVIYIGGDDEYTYEVYADSNKTKLLDTFTFNADTLSSQTIDVNTYLESASTVTHTYKLDANSGKYYFVSSVIK